MEYPRNSMKFFCEDRAELAVYVEEQLENLLYGSPWTMTITAEKSEAYSVLTVIEELSDDTDEMQVAKFFSETQLST